MRKKFHLPSPSLHAGKEKEGRTPETTPGQNLLLLLLHLEGQRGTGAHCAIEEQLFLAILKINYPTTTVRAEKAIVKPQLSTPYQPPVPFPPRY